MLFNRYRRGLFIASFLAAPVILYAIYVISPNIQAFYMAMTDWRGVSATPNFIGLENFQRVLGDSVFWKAVTHNLGLLVLLPAITIIIALFFAYLLNLGGSKGSPGSAGPPSTGWSSSSRRSWPSRSWRSCSSRCSGPTAAAC
ncbi:carbohydrate ABC transporter permease [Nonomuraea thailandensis]